MRLVVLPVFVALLLSGCASSFKGQFTNRPMCTMDGKDAVVVSYWTRLIGLAFQIDERDVAAVCRVAKSAGAAGD
jgi:hypothetical protein